MQVPGSFRNASFTPFCYTYSRWVWWLVLMQSFWASKEKIYAEQSRESETLTTLWNCMTSPDAWTTMDWFYRGKYTFPSSHCNLWFSSLAVKSIPKWHTIVFLFNEVSTLCVWMRVHKTEDSLRCQNAVHLIFGVYWAGVCMRLHWMASEMPWSSCVRSPNTGNSSAAPMPGILCEFWGWSLGLRAHKASTLLAKPSRQPKCL